MMLHVAKPLHNEHTYRSSNTHPSTTLYFKASIVSPPADYSVSSTNLGSLAPGANAVFTFTPVRAQPSLSAGEYDEPLTFRIDAYTDAGYSAPYANQTLSVTIHHFNHTDASWTVISHDTFDGADQDGWGGINVYRTSPGMPFYSSPAALVCPYCQPPNGGRGWSAYKDFTVGNFTKARIVFHYYTNQAESYQQTDILVDNICKKPLNLSVPASKWVRFAYNMFKNKTGRVYVTNWAYNGTVLIDEIWVIAK